MTKAINIDELKSPKWIAVIILAVFTVLTWVFSNEIYGASSVFNQDNFGNEALNSMCHSIPPIIRCITILFLAWVINYAAQIALEYFAKGSKAMVTTVKLLKSLVKYAIFIVAILFCLSAWGVNTTTLIASAGILSLIIGLGAQSLIADIIAGLFMVFENDFEVGDIVVIDGWRGTVMEIGMRTTKLVDYRGNIKIVNNSKISTVINQSKKTSVALCYISVEYGDDLPRIELVIRDNLEKVKDNIPQIINGPFYKGVDSLGDSSVNLLFLADCKEEDIYIVQRAMNREFKLLFDNNNINIPFPQVTVNQPVEFEKADNRTRTSFEARVFAEEQREASKGLELDQE
ncbi:MAG: mechanosensitive ion channel family protein [Candidatus Methanomethylophilus sp.]|nr:mechanosensitive ion channel family protein [Methanomethylophilus sp.]